MKNYSQIYHALWTWLSQGGEWKHKGHLITCIGIMMALLETRSVHLRQWIPYIPCRGVYAGGQQRRLQRWLHNSRINVRRLYQPLITSALAAWKEKNIYLSLDTSVFWDDYYL